MANNCLVTKLKATVDNSNLEKFGIFQIFFKEETNPTAESRFFSVTFSKKITIKCIGGQLYKTYGGASLGNSYTLQDVDWNAGQNGYVFSGYVSNNNCGVDVDKYSLSRINLTTSYVKDINVTKFKYSLVKIYYGSYLTGNIADIPNSPTYLSLNDNHKLAGTLADVAQLTSLRTAELTNSNVPRGLFSTLGTLTYLTSIQALLSGSIEDFVVAQRSNGRTTCTGITCKWIGDGGVVTFNGAAIANKASTTLSWTEDTITYDGTTISA